MNLVELAQRIRAAGRVLHLSEKLTSALQERIFSCLL